MASNKKELDELGLGSDSEDEQEEEQAVPPPPADETAPSAAAAAEAEGGAEAAAEAPTPGVHHPHSLRHIPFLPFFLHLPLAHPYHVPLHFTQRRPCPRGA
jgi:hypothetical protein